MDLNRVVTFVRVVEAGSFTEAARTLGAPKSSVSRGVAALEAALGVRLLHRTTRKLNLTEAGRAYYDGVRDAVAGLAEAGAAVGEMGNEPRGPIRLTAPYGSGFLAPVIAAFVARYPRVQVEVSLTGRHVDLVAEGFDLALRAGRLPDSSLVARKVESSDLALYAAPSYLRRRGRPQRLADLAAHDVVLFRSVSGHATLRLEGPGGEQTVEVTGRVSTDEMSFVFDAAVAGLGVALLPAQLAVEAVARGALSPVLPQLALTGGAVYVVLPSNRYVPTRVSLFRDFLVERLHELIGRSPCAAKAAARGRTASVEQRVPGGQGQRVLGGSRRRVRKGAAAQPTVREPARMKQRQRAGDRRRGTQ
jgi:DNA-binding transcriptional LysR family regulator